MSYTFKPCPICSGPKAPTRPEWFYCRHKSDATGIRHESLLGCCHATEVVAKTQFISDPEEKAMIVDAWNYTAGQLLEAKTEGWTDKAKACFVVAIGFSDDADGITPR